MNKKQRNEANKAKREQFDAALKRTNAETLDKERARREYEAEVKQLAEQRKARKVAAAKKLERERIAAAKLIAARENAEV